MNPNHTHILRHSLGLGDDGHGREYRDYYCAAIGDQDLLELCQAGLMAPGQKINRGEDQYFHVTPAGRKAALAGVAYPKRTVAQRRYHAWLRLDIGVTFGEFLRRRMYKDCAGCR